MCNYTWKVSKYNIKYKSLEEDKDNEEKVLSFDASEVKDGRMDRGNISFYQIKGRIEYAGYDVWSPWSSINRKVSHIKYKAKNFIFSPRYQKTASQKAP